MALPSDIQQRIAAQKAKGYSDAQISAAIRAKYGVDYPSGGGSAIPTQPRKSAVEKVGDFLNLTNFAKGLGVGGGLSRDVTGAQRSQEQLSGMTGKLLERARRYQAGDPRRERLLAEAGRNSDVLRETDLTEDDVTGGVSNREFLSSAGATGINVLGAGNIGGRAIGPGRFGTMRFAAQPLKAAVAQSALQGGGLSAARSVGEGRSAGEAAKSAIAPAVFAGGTTLALGLLGRAIQKALEKGPEKLYERAVPLRTTQETEKVIRGKATPVAPEAIRRGIRGSDRQILSQASDAVDDLEKQIKEAVATRVPVSAQDDLFQTEVAADLSKGGAAKIAKAAERFTGLDVDTRRHTPLLQDFLEQTKVALRKSEREAMERALSGRVSQADALTVRRIIDKYLPKGAFGLDLPNSAKTVALLDVANDLRGQIADVNPEAGRLLTQQSQMIRLRDAAGSLAAKASRRTPFSRIDALLGGGAAASFALGNPVLGAGLVGLPIARAAMTSPGIATRAAVMLDRLGQGAGRTVANTDSLRRLLRALVIAGAVGGPTTEEEPID